MASFVQGIEIEAPMARRSRHAARPITISLSHAERAFLLYRIKDVSGTAESILHNPTPGNMISPWPRDQVIGRVLELRRHLRKGGELLFVISPLDKRIAADAIERNPYFSAMHDNDPRLTVDAVRQASALRERVSAALGQRIARVPLGAGRLRLPDRAA